MYLKEDYTGGIVFFFFATLPYSWSLEFKTLVLVLYSLMFSNSEFNLRWLETHFANMGEASKFQGHIQPKE